MRANRAASVMRRCVAGRLPASMSSSSATEGERLELGHRADSRMIFARGALAAARLLADKPAGRYTMRDVIAAL